MVQKKIGDYQLLAQLHRLNHSQTKSAPFFEKVHHLGTSIDIKIQRQFRHHSGTSTDIRSRDSSEGRFPSRHPQTCSNRENQQNKPQGNSRNKQQKIPHLFFLSKMNMVVHACNSGTKKNRGRGITVQRVCAMRPSLIIFFKKLIHNSLVTKFNPLKHRISVWRYICKYTIPMASSSRCPVCFLSVTDGVYKELAKSKPMADPGGLSMCRQRKQGRDL